MFLCNELLPKFVEAGHFMSFLDSSQAQQNKVPLNEEVKR